MATELLYCFRSTFTSSAPEVMAGDELRRHGFQTESRVMIKSGTVNSVIAVLMPSNLLASLFFIWNPDYIFFSFRFILWPIEYRIM
jgi:hypothetical protein